MLQAIKGFFGSKTTMAAIAGAAIIGVLQYYKVPQDIINIVGGLFGLKIVQQASADFGKEKAKIESIK